MATLSPIGASLEGEAEVCHGRTLQPPPGAIPSGSDRAYFYGAHVEPIFVQNCYSCHGPEKQKSQLRLDSYEALMRGGKHGPVIKAGDVKGSELFRRVTLPSFDDDAMPAQGKRHL